MTRHDIPNEVKDFIEVAIEVRTIDALDVYALATKHGNDWRGLIGEVIEYAFSNRHWDSNQHKAVVQAAELFWMSDKKAEDQGFWEFPKCQQNITS
jgi:hypothetical protein